MFSPRTAVSPGDLPDGFQILCEAGLRVLRPNAPLEFVCADVRVERTDTHLQV